MEEVHLAEREKSQFNSVRSAHTHLHSKLNYAV